MDTFRRALVGPFLGLWVVGCALLPNTGSAHTGSLPPALTAFKTAWQRVNQGQPDQPDSAALQALPIYPYLVAARLQRDLTHIQVNGNAQQTDAAVGAFLNDHDGELVTQRLTTAWLRSLAQRQDWPLLLAHYDPARADSALRCQWFQARIATGETTNLAPEISKAYLTDHNLPDCRTPFGWLKSQQQLPASLTVRRAKMALRSGRANFARQLAHQLPDAQAAPLLQWAALLSQPEQSIRDLIAHPDKPVADEALRDGWLRLARKHTDTALQLYPAFLQARHLQGEKARVYTRDLALGLVLDRRPEATEYFARFTPKPGDTVAFTWRVRAALWIQDWKHVLQWTTAMPEALRSKPIWQYWHARAQAAIGDAQSAKTSYQVLATENGYYSLLSAWQLQRNYTPRTTAIPDDPALQSRLVAQPGVIRAHQLFEVGLNSQASLEWRVALSVVTSNDRVQGIRLAMRWGWYDQAVATASQQGVYEDYKLLYPLPYAAQVKTASVDSGLPENWIYGVIRQESLYRANVVSSANAYGLMQLLLPTARAVARRSGLPRPQNANALFDPETNLALGADLLRELTNQNNGRFIVALAGYNAGPNAANRWLPDSPISADVWIENIPYNETRRYVKRILWHIAVFGWRRSGEPQTIAELLPLVAQSAPSSQVASFSAGAK